MEFNSEIQFNFRRTCWPLVPLFPFFFLPSFSFPGVSTLPGGAGGERDQNVGALSSGPERCGRGLHRGWPAGEHLETGKPLSEPQRVAAEAGDPHQGTTEFQHDVIEMETLLMVLLRRAWSWSWGTCRYTPTSLRATWCTWMTGCPLWAAPLRGTYPAWFQRCPEPPPGSTTKTPSSGYTLRKNWKTSLRKV